MTDSSLPFPLIVIEGSARQRGEAYGSACRERIRGTIDFYRYIFQAEGGLAWSKALDTANDFAAPIADFDPEMMEEIRGIADGAGVPLAEILAINARSELLFLLSTGGASPAGSCTSLATLPAPSTDRPVLLAQNWDWYCRTLEHCVLLLVRQPPRPTILQVVEAGLIAKMGMNSAGIGLCTNALLTDGWRIGVPYHAILRGILNASGMAEALGAVTQARRASAGNYLIGHHDGLAVDIEASPDHHSLLRPKNGVLVHTNHFIAHNPINRDLMPGRWPDSLVREARANQYAADPGNARDADWIRQVLRDHLDRPTSICSHPCGQVAADNDWQTNASLIMDLTARSMQLTAGPPCENQYHAIDAGALLVGDRQSPRTNH